MSFIVRQISRTSDGREIIRPKEYTQPQLIIGRDAASDIHLPDLAVNLNHAVIQTITPGRIEIAATAGLPIEVDGRSTERAEIDVARGASVRIGSHVLSIGKGETAADVVISVERVGAVSDASEAKDEVRAFSLASAVPGKRALAWAFALLVIAAGLLWPLLSSVGNAEADKREARPIAFHADEMWSSGKLSLAHANLENNCKACHAKPGEAVRDEACAQCHTTIHDHVTGKDGAARLQAARAKPDAEGRVKLAGHSVFGIPAGRCAECHTEHEGKNQMPVTAQQFCSDCHTGLNTRLTDTKILNAGDFGTDHPEFRPAIMTEPGEMPVVRRLSLEARPLEDNGLKFPHDIHLSKTNGIARMTQTFAGRYGFGKSLQCKDCHVGDPSGARFEPVSMEKNCQMCHDLAYDRVEGTVRTLRHGDIPQVYADLRAFYRSGGPVRPISFTEYSRRRPGSWQTARFAPTGSAQAAITRAFTQGGACLDCHEVTQPGQNGTAMFGIVPVNLPARYMNKGWFDHKSHETETCQSCHAAEKSASASDVLLPKIASCRECHGGEKAAKQVPSSCAMCHDYHMDAGAPLMVRDSRERGKRAAQVKTAANN